MNDGYDVFELETRAILSHEDTLDEAIRLWRDLEKELPGVYWIKETEI